MDTMTRFQRAMEHTGRINRLENYLESAHRMLAHARTELFQLGRTQDAQDLTELRTKVSEYLTLVRQEL